MIDNIARWESGTDRIASLGSKHFQKCLTIPELNGAGLNFLSPEFRENAEAERERPSKDGCIGSSTSPFPIVEHATPPRWNN